MLRGRLGEIKEQGGEGGVRGGGARCRLRFWPAVSRAHSRLPEVIDKLLKRGVIGFAAALRILHQRCSCEARRPALEGCGREAGGDAGHETQRSPLPSPRGMHLWKFTLPPTA